MTDLHIHTTFSSDARSKMEDYVTKAIAMGKKSIGFSEHINLDFVYYGFDYERTVDIEACFTEIKRLREKYGDEIEILFGGEIGYDKNLVSEFKDLVSKYPFDYIINSVHLINGEDSWLMPFYENRTKKQAYDLYLDAVYDSVSADFPFEIIGHVGYVIRRIPFEDKSMGMNEFGDKIDKILKLIIERGKTLEINTNTRGMCDILPLIHIIERYISLGGRRFSFGSDAHDTTRLYENEEQVRAILRTRGIDEMLCFKNHGDFWEKL